MKVCHGSGGSKCERVGVGVWTGEGALGGGGVDWGICGLWIGGGALGGGKCD